MSKAEFPIQTMTSKDCELWKSWIADVSETYNTDTDFRDLGYRHLIQQTQTSKVLDKISSKRLKFKKPDETAYPFKTFEV